MSWILGKAEDLLNKVDQAAGQTLSTVKEQENDDSALVSVVTDKPFTSSHSTTASKIERHMSVPNVKTNVNTTSSYLTQTSKSSFSTTNKVSPQHLNTGANNKIKRDKDEELFEFLNAPDSDSNGSSNGRKSIQNNLTRHSRNSSGSSTFSNKSGKPADAKSTTTEGTTDFETEGVMEQSLEEDTAIEFLPPNTEQMHGENESSLELENKLLKNEITSLNQEMASVIERAKHSQEESQRIKRKLDLANQQLSKSDQIVREMQAREADTAESMKAKDAQIGVLRVRFEEADKELKIKEKRVEEITAERDRVLKDHTSASGMQSHALDSLKEKLHETEENLRKEKEVTNKTQQEAQERQRKMEAEQQNLSEALSQAQRKYNDEKSRTTELNTQLKLAKNQLDTSKGELTDYKDKASRILQSKDKLITSLKEGTVTDGTSQAFATAELDSAKQEIGILKEEIQHNKMTAENLRTEIQDLEIQMQQDGEVAQDQIQSLEEQLKSERVVREDAEAECARQKEELRYAHEELLKQKTGFQSRLQDREAEIEKLRNQLTNRNLSNSSQVELENRLHSLTESLIQKQTMMESLSTEKNSLSLQLERLERKYKELELTSSKSHMTTVHISEEDDARQRMPGFLKESPTDNEIARRVKRVYGTVDKFSIRLGVFLRRYPIARMFIFGYMALLHIWVMIVLLTYQPEIHGLDFENSHQPVDVVKDQAAVNLQQS